MGAIASHITSLTIVYSTVYSGADQRKHQSSASLAFVRGIHRSPVNSPRKGPVTRKSFHLMTSSWFHWPIYKYHRWWKQTKKYWSLPWWLTIKDILPSLFDISFLELHEWRVDMTINILDAKQHTSNGTFFIYHEEAYTKRTQMFKNVVKNLVCVANFLFFYSY